MLSAVYTGRHKIDSWARIFTYLFVNGRLVPSSHAAFASMIVPNCNNIISVLACPVLHKVWSPDTGRHTRNNTDSTEKNGSSHDNTLSNQRPRLSIPGCFIATVIDIAIVRLESGTDVNGLNIMTGSQLKPVRSKRSPAVTSNPQKTMMTIDAWNRRKRFRQNWKNISLYGNFQLHEAIRHWKNGITRNTVIDTRIKSDLCDGTK